ncbi:MAG: TRAP transporter small permease [Desulfopila sp.]
MFRKYLRRITAAMNILSVVSLAVILSIMFVDIVLRYTIKVTILGAYEIIEYFMVVAVAFCMAHTEILDGHVKVTMLTEKLAPAVRRGISLVGDLLQAALLFIVMYANIEQAQYAMAKRAASEVHNIPTFPFYYVIAAGFGVFALVMVLRAVEVVTRNPVSEVQSH